MASVPLRLSSSVGSPAADRSTGGLRSPSPPTIPPAEAILLRRIHRRRPLHLPRSSPTSRPLSPACSSLHTLPARNPPPSISTARRDPPGLTHFAGFPHPRIRPPPPPHICFLEPNKNLASSYTNKSLVIEAATIEGIYDRLADRLIQILDAAPPLPASKLIIGLAGPPGAGKTTVAAEVTRRLNAQWRRKSNKFGQICDGDVAIAVPMDGFHLYRSQLDRMENPEEAHARRGAAWTFDPARLLLCLETLRKQGEVSMPSFDHGVGDPVEDDIKVTQNHRIVIVEGNYLLLEEDIWREISSLFDEKWFVEVDIDVAMERVLGRHVATGKTWDVARWRIEYNDRPNAEIIMESKANADVLIRSVDVMDS